MLYIVTRCEELHYEDYYDLGVHEDSNCSYICGVYESYALAEARVRELAEACDKADCKGEDEQGKWLRWDVGVDDYELCTFTIREFDVNKPCDCPV